MGNPLPFLRIASPAVFKTPEQQTTALVVELNRTFEQLTRWLKDNSEQSDKVREFGADIDMDGHQIHHLADPQAPTDGANRRYVDEKNEVLGEAISDIVDEVHNGPSETPKQQWWVLKRALPTVVNDTIEIGAFEMVALGLTFDLAITLSQGGMSIAKAYTIVSQFGMNNVWQIALPLFDTGEYVGQNFELDIKQDSPTNSVALRLRRTLGTTAGTATIQITGRGLETARFIEGSATASATAPTTFFQTAALTHRGGNVGINTSAPNRSGTGVALTMKGTEGTDARMTVEMENPLPGTLSGIGMFRYFTGATLLGQITVRCDGTTDSAALVIALKEAATGITAQNLLLSSRNNLVLGPSSAPNGEVVLVLARGVAPTSNAVDAVSLYSVDAVAGNACLGILTENGQTVKLFSNTALTAADANAITATWSATTATTVSNMRVRINELETKLRANGLLL